MNKVLIVEDDASIAGQLKRITNKINSKIVVKTTGSSLDALEYVKNNDISLFFFDIELVDFSGIELAKQIRKIHKYEFTPIVFISGIASRELEAFRETHCYHFITKPFLVEEVERVFQKMLVNYMKEKNSETNEVEDKMILTFKNHSQMIFKRDILFVEYHNRKIFIVLAKEKIEYIHMPLKKMKSMLPNYFIQVHQSFVVNKNYIRSINFKEQEIIVADKTNPIPIGRSFRHSVRGALNEFL